MILSTILKIWSVEGYHLSSKIVHKLTKLYRTESNLSVTCSHSIANILTTKKTFARTTKVKQCVLHVITKNVNISKIALYFLFIALFP